MKVGYIVLGIIAIALGVCNWCGLDVLSPFAAGCYAIAFGCMALNEAGRI